MDVQAELERQGILTLLRSATAVSRRPLESFVKGGHPSSYPGTSTEFAEYKQYVHGDDLRRLDWRVFSRFERFYVRRYREEVAQRCHLVLDRSGSMRYPTTGRTKLETAELFAGALAYLFLHQHDEVGLWSFADGTLDQVPASDSPAQLFKLYTALGTTAAAGHTELEASCRLLAPRLPAGALVVLFSDLFYQLGDDSAVWKALDLLRGPRVKVVLVHVTEPGEHDLSGLTGRVVLRCLESDARLLVKVDELRQLYRRRMQAFVERLATSSGERGVVYLPLSTQDDLAEVLGRVLHLQGW